MGQAVQNVTADIDRKREQHSGHNRARFTVQVRKLIKLFAVFFLLSAYYFLFEYGRKPEEGIRGEVPVFRTATGTLLPAEVQSIRLPKLLIERDEKGHWTTKEPSAALASPAVLDRILRFLSEAKTKNRFAPSETLGSYGLYSAPTLEITAGKEHWSLLVGNRISAGTCYAMLQGENLCLELDDRFLSLLNTTLFDVRFSKPTQLRPEMLQRMTLCTPASGETISFVKKDPDWFLDKPVQDRAVNPLLVFKRLLTEDIQDWIAGEAPDRTPDFTLMLEDDQGRQETLSLWREPGERSRLKCRSSVQSQPFWVDDIDLQDCRPDLFRDTRLAVPPPAEIARLEIRHPGKERQTIECTSTERGKNGTYEVVEPYRLETDFNRLEMLCEALARIQSVGFRASGLDLDKKSDTYTRYTLRTFSGRIYDYFLEAGEPSGSVQERGRPLAMIVQARDMASLMETTIQGRRTLFPFAAEAVKNIEIDLLTEGLISLQQKNLAWEEHHERPDWVFPARFESVQELIQKLFALKTDRLYPVSDYEPNYQFELQGRIKIVPQVDPGTQNPLQQEFLRGDRRLEFGQVRPKPGRQPLPFRAYAKWVGKSDFFELGQDLYRALVQTDYRTRELFVWDVKDVSGMKIQLLHDTLLLQARREGERYDVNGTPLDLPEWQDILSTLKEMKIDQFLVTGEKPSQDANVTLQLQGSTIPTLEFFFGYNEQDRTAIVGRKGLPFLFRIENPAKVQELIKAVQRMRKRVK